MAFDFPFNPPTGTAVVMPDGTSRTWDGGKWVAGAFLTGTSGLIAIGSAPPISPKPGDSWWDTVSGQLFIRYDDGNSVQWVVANSQPAGINDAPSDSITYGRRNSTWANVATAPQVQTNVGRNLVHNGLFNIWQRGTSFTASGFSADRWQASFSGDTGTFYQQAFADAQRTQVGDEAVVYSFNTNWTGSAAATAYTLVAQSIEGVRRLAGKTVTVSFYAGAGTAGLKLGVSLDQNFGTGGSPSPFNSLNGVAVTLSTTWQRYSVTFNVPSIVGKTLGTNNNDFTYLNFWYSSGANQAARAGNIGVQSGLIGLWGVQLEIGTQATPLEKLDPRMDLANCQRFYQSGGACLLWSNVSAAGSQVGASTSLPVNMRATPTVTVLANSSGNLGTLTIGADGTDTVYMFGSTTAAGSFGLNATFTASADL